MIIPSRFYWLGGGALAVILAITLWFRAHDARIRREERVRAVTEAVEAERAYQDSINMILRDSLRSARIRTDTVRVAVTTAGQSYARQRAVIDVRAPQPAGVPAGSVVVPVAFVESADSLAKLVPVLLATITAERVASERRIDALLRSDSLARMEIEQLRIQIQAAKPGITGRLKWAAVGAGVAIGVVTLLRN